MFFFSSNSTPTTPQLHPNFSSSPPKLTTAQILGYFSLSIFCISNIILLFFLNVNKACIFCTYYLTTLCSLYHLQFHIHLSENVS